MIWLLAGAAVAEEGKPNVLVKADAQWPKVRDIPANKL